MVTSQTSSAGPGGVADKGGTGGGTWANMVVKGNAQSRKKLNILNVHLERDDKSTPFQLNKEELAKLITRARGG